ncbi:MAG: hypothetical protein JJE30_08575 [Desulfuromonadales bacterium]|nr:hypothetical protein [Desulfuromonadales bacterium]
MDTSEANEFDFTLHQKNSEYDYQKLRPMYEAFAEITKDILINAINVGKITVASIDARAKEIDSFGKKSAKPSKEDSNRPKYLNPIKDITDLAGVRVITFFPRTLLDVDQIINEQFTVIEKFDKADLLHKDGKLGYQSVHYLVSLTEARTKFPEYSRYADLIAEIQVRTILQHAWAEIEHDIQYKSVEVIPTQIRRRFTALAGLFEIADREFQAIQDADEEIRLNARTSVEEGKLEVVEITPDALKTFLNKRLGSDGRMSDYSYEFTARMLRKFGFLNFKQIDECIAGYDGYELGRILWGTSQGQMTRFELMLLAGMGDDYIKHHPYANAEWFAPFKMGQLEKFSTAGIAIGNYVPSSYEE